MSRSGSTGYGILKEPTILNEDNASVLHQVQHGFIKGDKTKHIALKFFYVSEVNGIEVKVTKVSSSENIADIFTKSLPSTTHWYLLKKIGMRRLSEFKGEN